MAEETGLGEYPRMHLRDNPRRAPSPTLKHAAPHTGGEAGPKMDVLIQERTADARRASGALPRRSGARGRATLFR